MTDNSKQPSRNQLGIDKHKVAALLDMSVRTVEDWGRAGVDGDGDPFPRPRRITRRLYRWDIDEVYAYWDAKANSLEDSK
ncbi:MAG: DNA-binding protein [Planctomycetota bacterium]